MSDKQLSVVFSYRNDNYFGEDTIQQFRYCIDSLNATLDGIDYEIVVVDYNVNEEKPPLSSLFLHPHIRHVEVSKEEHFKFVDKYLKQAKYEVLKNYDFKPEYLYDQFPMFPHYGQNIGLQHARGEYVLSADSDSIFPLGLGSIISSLQHNIIYRAFRRHIDPDNLKNEYDNILHNRQFKKNSLASLIDRKTNNLYKAQGSFVLMDRESWLEVGGYLPIPHPRLIAVDGQFIFFGLVKNKKMYCLDYRFVNVFSRAEKRHRVEKYVNFIVEKDGIQYNHFEELRHPSYLKVAKWAKLALLEPNKEYFLDCSEYEPRYNEIKHLFKQILDD